MSLDLAARDSTSSSRTVKSSSSDQGKAPESEPPFLWRALQWCGRAITWPLRSYLNIRRSMTVGSVAALLGCFLTLNVIWGFPWSGLMGACVAMLLIGFAINRLMGPRMKLSVALPRSAIAGNPFSLTVRLTNRGFLPAMNLRVGWYNEDARDTYLSREEGDWEASAPVSVELLRSGDQMQWHGAMQYFQRGVYELPQFQVTSSFPFHLFRNRQGIATDTKIAITPAPASADEDPSTRVMLSAIGDWTKQLVAGAPVEYIGNREYQEGVPVRRWDFASWARLGRPIVREYQAPSIQAVSLIVDTSLPTHELDTPQTRAAIRERTKEADLQFERLMSISATAISDIIGRRVQLSLYLTSESGTASHIQLAGNVQSEGGEGMQVRLAAAKPVESELSVQRIRDAIEDSRSRPILLFSLWDLDAPERFDLARDLPVNVTYLPIRPKKQEQVA